MVQPAATLISWWIMFLMGVAEALEKTFNKRGL